MLVEQLAQYPALWIATLIVLGLLVGSFLNVVILRLPKSLEQQWHSQCHELLEIKQVNQSTPLNIAYPASHCPRCKTPLKWWHNIPLLSYILLRGRCHACNTTISIRYPLIEIATALLTLLAGLVFPETRSLPWILLAVWMLLAMAMIDYDTQYLPDILTLPLMWLGLIYSLFTYSPVTPSEAIIGAASGYMVLWLIYQAHHLLTGREGMGYGDFKLLAAAGAWLGWQVLPFVLLISAAAGLLITLIITIFGQHKISKAVPFGPYLAIAFLLTLFWGDTLIRVYLNFTGLS